MISIKVKIALTVLFAVHLSRSSSILRFLSECSFISDCSDRVTTIKELNFFIIKIFIVNLLFKIWKKMFRYKGRFFILIGYRFLNFENSIMFWYFFDLQHYQLFSFYLSPLAVGFSYFIKLLTLQIDPASFRCYHYLFLIVRSLAFSFQAS
jgi:hypothetical protein